MTEFGQVCAKWLGGAILWLQQTLELRSVSWLIDLVTSKQKSEKNSPLMSAGQAVATATAGFQWDFKMRGVPYMCWQILEWGALVIFADKF